MRPTTIERAFQLAESGQCRTFTQIARALAVEGYSDVRSQLDGQFIRKQLGDLLARAVARGDGASSSMPT